MGSVDSLRIERLVIRHEHGPLPILLPLLTVVSGLVDAVTYLKFGHVFVAHMTGNIVVLGFGLAGDPGISIVGSLIALGTFLLGALAGGRLGRGFARDRGSLLAASASINFGLLGFATICAFLGASPLTIIPALGVMMGMQNAVVRQLAVPDTTTTVLTSMLTGLMADLWLVGGPHARFSPRITAVIVMFIGALSGAAIVLRAGVAPALFVAMFITAVVGTFAYILSRNEPEWTHGAA